MAGARKKAPAKKPKAKRKRLRESKASRAARVEQILAVWRVQYGDADCALQHDTVFQLVIATILSAQCTDARVNIVTRQLFAEYPDAPSMAAAPVKTLEKIIHSTGFFRNKAKNIKGCATRLVEHFGGEVPQTMDELLSLPGVARKTANVVLGTGFGLNEGVVVDTHVGRISRRLKLTAEEDPVKVERDLCAQIPRAWWTWL
ncbi:MAG: endonuclease III domain-containing protein, partial [Planctomycetota bacterium]